MKTILAVLALAVGLCASAFAQTYPPVPVTGYINEQGNLFAMTHTPDGHSPFHVQMQTVVEQPPPGEVMSDLVVTASGQNGGYSCGRGCSGVNQTYFPWLVDASGVQYAAVWIMTAAPAFNPDGTPVAVPDMRYPNADCVATPYQCIQRYDDVAPAVDGGGNPITFTPIVSTTGKITGWHLDNKPPVDANGVPLYAALPAGYYNLHEVGTSCSGRSCQLPGQSLLLTRSTASYYLPPPPPPTCGTPTTPPCDE